MTGPALLAHDAQYSPGADSSTLTSAALTVSNGDVIVVKAATWDTGTSMSTPTGGGQTYQPVQIVAPGGFAGWSGTWVCTVTGNPGSFSIVSAPSAASRHSMVVEQWGSAFVDPSPAVFSTTHGSTATMSAPITTTAANSVVSLAMVEENSRDPSGHTWTAGTVEDGLYDGHSGSNSVHYFAYTPVAAAGPTTIDLTVPAGSLNWTISGIEIKAATTSSVNLSASLTGTGSLSGTLTGESRMVATLTGTGGLSATLSVPTVADLSAHLTATSGMTAVISLPTLGPTDQIGTPAAEKLMACFIEKLSTLPNPPRYTQIRIGAEGGPLIGPNVDECCDGLAWIRVANIYPSWDSFPAEDNTWTPGAPFAYAVVLEMGVSFCMSWSDSTGTFDDIDPPSGSDWQAAFTTQMQHQTLMREAAACCWPWTTRRAVGGWTPLSVEGGCTGGTLTVTVSVMAPCSDC